MDKFLNQVTRYALYLREDNPDWDPKRVVGIGPSRAYYLLSKEVIAGSSDDGFHRNERPMVGRYSWTDEGRYLEFPGFTCANRSYRVRSSEECSSFIVKLVLFTVLPSPEVHHPRLGLYRAAE